MVPASRGQDACRVAVPELDGVAGEVAGVPGLQQGVLDLLRRPWAGCKEIADVNADHVTTRSSVTLAVVL